MLFTSYLYWSMVPKAPISFLLLPKRTRIGVLRVGSVLAPTRRGAQGRSGHAAGRLPGSGGSAPPAATSSDPAADSSARWSVSPAAPVVGPLSRPSTSAGPGPQLAERARRAIPDPQHGLASMQRDLPHGCGEVLRSLRINERLHPAEVCGTSHVRRAVHRGQVH